MNDEYYMKKALELAVNASEIDEVPIGCIIVYDDVIIGTGYNKRMINKNTLYHAEIVAINEACQYMQDWRLEECTMYVTVEPCAMCAGAILQSRIKTVVFGTYNRKAGFAGSLANIFETYGVNHNVEVIAGVMEIECSSVMTEYFKKFRKNKGKNNMIDKITIQHETENQYKENENVTREAFWNLYTHGCDEHYLLHKMRTHEDYIQELSFVAMLDNCIVGNIACTKSYILREDGKKVDTVTFGPISVLPQYQKKGIGKMLIEAVVDKAKDMGYVAIIIFGYPDYYKKAGFVHCKEYGVYVEDKVYPYAHLIHTLVDNCELSGQFHESEVFEHLKDGFVEYDKGFVEKEKFDTLSQKQFAETVRKVL